MHGFKAVKDKLAKWLKETSEYGCGDDVTVVMAYKQIIPIPVKRISQEQFTKIYTAITRDHPLIYHMNQSACNLATDGLGHTAIRVHLETKQKAPNV